ncbi:uncharacterized protein LOC118811018 [Colossoma macropomum]|uniref:uncharacterized protein LOC118811018 n=1 Tax=Colossoma macropomum TaxID=42526 RepID=UPI0018645B78|nr:uncharacterized protein LOC118811018 [Colossoma macropomum]
MQLQDSQNELHNFKERMGKVVDLKLGSSGVLSEDLTNPCRESELKHMYEKLSKNQWAKLLRQLKTGGPEMTKEKIKENRKKAEDVIQAVLRESQHDIQNITGTMLCLTPGSQDPSNKTTQYFDLAVQNLQIAIYQEKMQLYNIDKLQDVPEALYPMIDDCYKTGCLMALHNPPLLLDWDSCGQGPFPPIKIGKFVPVKEKNYDTDSLQKSSAAQPGAQIPDGNREPVKSEPLKETEEDINGALRMTSLPDFAAQPQTPTFQRQSSVPVKPEPLKETEEDKNGALRMTSLPAQPDPHKEKEDGNTSPVVSAPQQRPQPPQKRKSRPAQPDPHKEKEEDINTSPVVSAPQQRPQPPQKRKSRPEQPVQQKEKQQNVNAARVGPPLPTGRQQTQRPTTDHPENTTETDTSIVEARGARRNMPCLCIILGPIFLGMFFIVCGLFGLEWHQYSTSKWR